MRFRLDAPNGSYLIFPLEPTQITVAVGPRVQTFSTTQLGDFSFPRGNLPIKVSFEALLPGAGRQTIPVVHDWAPPVVILENLKAWSGQDTVNGPANLHFAVQDDVLGSPIVLPQCFIESLEARASGGFGDISVTISLQEWRELKVQLLGTTPVATAGVSSPLTPGTPSPDDTANPTPRPAAPKPATYTVAPGDSLWTIAQSQLGDGSRWSDIYNTSDNASTIGSNPDLITPGMVLTMPSS